MSDVHVDVCNVQITNVLLARMDINSTPMALVSRNVIFLALVAWITNLIIAPVVKKDHLSTIPLDSVCSILHAILLLLAHNADKVSITTKLQKLKERSATPVLIYNIVFSAITKIFSTAISVRVETTSIQPMALAYLVIPTAQHAKVRLSA